MFGLDEKTIEEKYNTLYDILDESEFEEEAFDELISHTDHHKIQRGLVHFLFRNGPIEDMHSNGQLSQEDMKILNKHMMNRMAYVVDLLMNQKWYELAFLIDNAGEYGTMWDEAKPDDGKIKEMLANFVIKSEKKVINK